MKYSNRLSLQFLLIVSIFLGGCAKKYDFVRIEEDLKTKMPEDLQERYLEYWESKTEAEYKITFGYELPYLQYLKPLEQYLEFEKGSKTKYKIKALELKYLFDDTVSIQHEIDYGYSKKRLSDKWIKVNNIWYHYYYPSLLPPL